MKQIPTVCYGCSKWENCRRPCRKWWDWTKDEQFTTLLAEAEKLWRSCPDSNPQLQKLRSQLHKFFITLKALNASDEIQI